VIPLLRQTLEPEQHLGARRFAAYALGDLARNTIYLRDDDPLRSEDTEELPTIEQVIGAAADGLTSNAKKIRDGMGDEDEKVRGYCLQAILESAKALTDHIGSTRSVLRQQGNKTSLQAGVNAIFQAMQTVNPRVLDQLHKHREINVRLSAMHTMDQICQCRSKLIQTLLQDDKLMQSLLDGRTTKKSVGTAELLKAVHAQDPLENVVEKGDWKKLVALLEDRNDDIRIRRGAIEVLEQLGDQVEPAAGAVERALNDPDRQIRWAATRTMRHLPPEKISSAAIGALGRLLGDPDTDLSGAAADVLGELGLDAKEAVDALVYHMMDGDVENRIKAMNALVRIGGAAGLSATPKLMESLNDSDVRIRRAAAETLGQFGAAAKAAIPALRAAGRDVDPVVRLNASEAILTIAAAGKKL
jgi:hypothetical protein